MHRQGGKQGDSFEKFLRRDSAVSHSLAAEIAYLETPVLRRHGAPGKQCLHQTFRAISCFVGNQKWRNDRSVNDQGGHFRPSFFHAIISSIVAVRPSARILSRICFNRAKARRARSRCSALYSGGSNRAAILP